MADSEQAITGWAEAGGAPLRDLEWLDGIVGEAAVVGIGVPTHGARELTTLADRMVRHLVERLGVRAVAMDEQATVAAGVDRYVTRGAGDPRAAVGTLWPHHRTVEVLGLVGRPASGWSDRRSTPPIHRGRRCRAAPWRSGSTSSCTSAG